MPPNYASALRNSQVKSKASNAAAEPGEEYPALAAGKPSTPATTDLTGTFQALSIKDAAIKPQYSRTVRVPETQQADWDALGHTKAPPQAVAKPPVSLQKVEPNWAAGIAPASSHSRPVIQTPGIKTQGFADVDWKSAKHTPDIPEWKEEHLNKASKAVYKGMGFRAAAAQYNVTIADLRHYYDQHFTNDDDDGDSDEDY